MIYAKFTPTITSVTTKAVTQWDYGRKLLIQGLKLPTAVRIDFGVAGAQTTKSRIGTTKDGITEVVIPDSLLEQPMPLVAYVYVTDSTQGKTVRTINIPVEARPRPEEYDTPESKQLFGETIEAVNDATERAEKARNEAESYAEDARESRDATLETIQAEGAGQVKAIQDEASFQLEQIQTAGEHIVEASATAEQNAKNVLANAIKGQLEGEAVTANDVSGVEHEMNVKVICPEGVEPSTVNVIRRGKNVFDVNAITGAGGVSNNGNGTITAKNLVSQPSEKLKEMCPFLKAGDVATFSFNSPAKDETKMSDNGLDFIYLVGARESWKSGQSKVVTQEMLDGVIYFYATKNSEGNAVATNISEIQIEIGNVATEYEPYNAAAYTASYDGTVAGITSLSPTMTILTDTEGVVIECEYNVDTQTYIDRKFEELKAAMNA